MRIFKVPFNMKREEKIFGGYLSLRQVLYLMFAASSLFIFATALPIFIKMTISSLISLLFILFAFLKVNEQYFDKLFFYALKFLFRKRKYVYERCCK